MSKWLLFHFWHSIALVLLNKKNGEISCKGHVDVPAWEINYRGDLETISKKLIDNSSFIIEILFLLLKLLIFLLFLDLWLICCDRNLQFMNLDTSILLSKFSKSGTFGECCHGLERISVWRLGPQAFSKESHFF